jgi:hypothetical protein
MRYTRIRVFAFLLLASQVFHRLPARFSSIHPEKSQQRSETLMRTEIITSATAFRAPNFYTALNRKPRKRHARNTLEERSLFGPS